LFVQGYVFPKVHIDIYINKCDRNIIPLQHNNNYEGRFRVAILTYPPRMEE
jgi:hypothetical protein